jgi:hypothetical protein
MEPLGDFTNASRTSHYLRFFAPWRYLRYDRRPPTAIAALLPAGRTVANPFYYSKLDNDAEVARLYPAMLRYWQAGSAQVIFTQLFDADIRYAAGLEHSVVSAVPPDLRTFVYRRQMGHLSGSGNHLVAAMAHDILLAREPSQLQTIETENDESAPPFPKPLDQFTKAEILLGDQPAAVLDYVQGPDATPDHDEAVDFRRDGVRSLLFLHGTKSIYAGTALTGERPLTTGLSLHVELDCAGRRSTHELGRVRILGETGAVAEVSHPALRADSLWRGELFLLPERLGLPPRSRCSGRLVLGGQPILQVQTNRGGDLLMTPLRGRMVTAKPRPDTLLRPESLPDRGQVRVRFEGSEPWEWAFGRFSKQSHRVAWNLQGLHKYIRFSPGSPRAQVSSR